jgi:hypothetical protein
MNELLLWMSARRSGSRQSLRAKVAELEPSGLRTGARYRQAEWDLSKLGHAEFGAASTGGPDWRIAPPVLAAGDYDEPCRAVLCGARTPRMIEALTAHAVSDSVDVRSQRLAPDLVSVSAASPDELAQLAAAAGFPLQWNAAMAVLMAATPPRAVPLERITMPIGGWTVSRFSKSQLAWVDSSVGEASSVAGGLFRFRAERQPTSYVLVERHEPYACDPASAKYRILHRSRRRTRPMFYDAGSQELAVRTSCRPPALVDRALVICSGALPAFRDDRIIYGGVERGVAAAVAALLGQRLN